MADALHLVFMVRKPTKHALHAAIGARIQTCRPDGKHSAANAAERAPSCYWYGRTKQFWYLVPIYCQYITNISPIKGSIHACLVYHDVLTLFIPVNRNQPIGAIFGCTPT